MLGRSHPSVGRNMARAFNFSSGPAALPLPVLEQAKAELLDWQGERASVMEVSHRGKAFMAMAEQSEADLRELLSIPSNYKVLFLQGGATTHFALLPLNFARGQVVDHVVTGQWSQKAYKESKGFATPRVAASSESTEFRSIPSRGEWQLYPNAAYVHIASNEAIGGVEFHDA